MLRFVMRNKEQVAQELAQWHFEVEPDLVRVVRVVGTNEDDPNEPIKLLEVNAATLSTGSVEPFGFTPTQSIPFRTVIAEVTPEEFERIRKNEIGLPEGWSLSETVFERPAA